MPTELLNGEIPVIQFDPQREMSPFTLFRRLRDGAAPLLVDVRPAPGELTLRGATPWQAGFQPPGDRDTVLFDDDGERALALVEELHAAGHTRVRALFGGLDLYEFALDPQVVGAETYLERS